MAPASPNVLVHCPSADLAHATRRALADEGIPSHDGDSALPDVIVADGPVHIALATLSRHVARAEVGIVSLSDDPDADISLASGWSPRELALACRLLAEIVRLRRQHRQQEAHELELEQLAYLDPLTDLANRRAWDNELSRRIVRLRDGGPPFCLALVDVDHFKGINDEHGHLVGDAVLRALAQALRAHVRDRDVIARLGGDEFGLLLEHVTPGFAAEVVDRIRAQALITAVGQPEPRVTFTASAGYCCAESSTTATPESLYAVADRGLGQAKSAGRNRTASSDGLA
jgi:diguanylate cyclase (GGDEF)-like protein